MWPRRAAAAASPLGLSASWSYFHSQVLQQRCSLISTAALANHRPQGRSAAVACSRLVCQTCRCLLLLHHCLCLRAALTLASADLTEVRQMHYQWGGCSSRVTAAACLRRRMHFPTEQSASALAAGADSSGCPAAKKQKRKVWTWAFPGAGLGDKYLALARLQHAGCLPVAQVLHSMPLPAACPAFFGAAGQLCKGAPPSSLPCLGRRRPHLVAVQ